MKPLIGVSSCLLGNLVRYDGRLKHEPRLSKLFGDKVEWLPICPEVELGLSIPREKIILLYDVEHPSLQTLETQIDLTRQMQNWIEAKIHQLQELPLKGFIFKAKSPSCGIQNVEFFSSRDAEPQRIGTGLFAKAFIETFPHLPYLQESDLDDPALVKSFLGRILS
ncbi:MAG: DUF523 domain-containing protein [Candidatus Cloacimonadaceae bacterium]|jgi:uncharacterized protein YbbK (DUF523 family)